jgi:hypothetical protein
MPQARFARACLVRRPTPRGSLLRPGEPKARSMVRVTKDPMVFVSCERSGMEGHIE